MNAETDAGGEGVPPGGWRRFFGLFFVTLALSVVQPTILVGVPLVLMAVVLPVKRVGAYVGAAVAAFLVLGGGRDGLWYAERGWAILAAGWFVALTLRWPAKRFTTRALGALAGAGAVAGLILWLTPGGWSSLDWRVGERMRSGIATAMEALRLIQGEGEALSPALVAAVYRTGEVQAQIFPAMLGVATLAALGASWWLYVRLAFGTDRGLGPLREFRFNDHLVWLFIGGLVLVVTGGGGLARTGSNAVVFMGSLYALRGAAVVVFLGGGVSAFGALMLALGLLFVAPVVLAGALVIGLGDTWLDIRRRIREAAA